MVHNQPSGDVTPSRADIEMARAVREAVKAAGISLHDHLVVGRGHRLPRGKIFAHVNVAHPKN